jgi:hypothetical protein
VEAGSGARALMHIHAYRQATGYLAWCGYLYICPRSCRRSALLHSFLHVSARPTKELRVATHRSRYSKPVMRSVCSSVVLLSIPIWRRRDGGEDSKAYRSNQDSAKMPTDASHSIPGSSRSALLTKHVVYDMLVYVLHEICSLIIP